MGVSKTPTRGRGGLAFFVLFFILGGVGVSFSSLKSNNNNNRKQKQSKKTKIRHPDPNPSWRFTQWHPLQFYCSVMMAHKSIHQSKTCRILDSVALFSFYLHSAFLILFSLAPHISPLLRARKQNCKLNFVSNVRAHPIKDEVDVTISDFPHHTSDHKQG